MKPAVDQERSFRPEEGWIDGCTKDQHTINSDWVRTQQFIDAVKVKEIRNVVKENGVLTELFRTDWALDDGVVDQVFQVRLSPGDISAWHVHQSTIDRLFASSGLIKVVLYDARSGSPTHQLINEFLMGPARPLLVVVPPGVWHGIQNVSQEPGCLINLVDRAYAYEDPDHWRLPVDTPQIPYSFRGTPTR